jgi:hypothetical protein
VILEIAEEIAGVARRALAVGHEELGAALGRFTDRRQVVIGDVVIERRLGHHQRFHEVAERVADGVVVQVVVGADHGVVRRQREIRTVGGVGLFEQRAVGGNEIEPAGDAVAHLFVRFLRVLFDLPVEMRIVAGHLDELGDGNLGLRGEERAGVEVALRRGETESQRGVQQVDVLALRVVEAEAAVPHQARDRGRCR